MCSTHASMSYRHVHWLPNGGQTSRSHLILLLHQPPCAEVASSGNQLAPLPFDPLREEVVPQMTCLEVLVAFPVAPAASAAATAALSSADQKQDHIMKAV
eukprot:6176527-Pleurochrysis_carterae.AAC.1